MTLATRCSSGMSSTGISPLKAAISISGKFGFTAATLPAGSLIGDIKLSGLNVDLVVNIPLV